MAIPWIHELMSVESDSMIISCGVSACNKIWAAVLPLKYAPCTVE